MRLLLVADIHYSLRQLEWIEANARDVDGVLLAGDLLDLTGHVPLDEQRCTMERSLRRLAQQLPIFVVSGNHDVDGPRGQARWLASLEGPGLFVDGGTVAWQGVAITLWPWASNQMRPAAKVPAPQRHAADSGSWIWLHHEPPAGTRIGRAPSGRPDGGTARLNERILKHRPTLVVCGHLHEAPYLPGGSWWDRIGETLVVNPGRVHGEVPSHIVLDLAEGRLSWVAPTGIDEIDLPLPEPLAGVA